MSQRPLMAADTGDGGSVDGSFPVTFALERSNTLAC